MRAREVVLYIFSFARVLESKVGVGLLYSKEMVMRRVEERGSYCFWCGSLEFHTRSPEKEVDLSLKE